ncbi:MAG: hypothetical protein HY688_03785 [Chloroflexi bacterium]|nr:hypothetical protein [Chloroflexota bacterium]
MDMEQKADKGYHIREFPEEARRLAKAGAVLDGVSVGEWIARAVRDKWRRRDARRGGERRRVRKQPERQPEKEAA